MSTELALIIFAPVLALVTGFAVFLFMKLRQSSAIGQFDSERIQEKAQLEERLRGADTEISRLRGEIGAVTGRCQQAEKESRTLAEELSAERARSKRIGELEAVLKQRDEVIREMTARDKELSTRVAQLETSLDKERKAAAEKLALLEEAKDTLSKQFKVLANEIFEQNTTKFTEVNKEKVEGILKPLGERLQQFQKVVSETNEKNVAGRAALMKELEHLQKLNTRLSDDATNLTKALKGETKTQGNWGELILERILEESGLTKGVEYDVQVSEKAEDGARLQPDVIIRLPEGKSIIVDSKVTLTAYERWVSADDDTKRAVAQKEHIQALRNHIRGLSEKNYQSLPGVETVDFVLMFVPIESAFGMAVQVESNIFYEAFRRNVVIVTPSTLLATLRTIAHIWQQERQNRNVDEIARLAGTLYDKFEGFISDLEKVGKELDDAKKAHDQAVKKLSEGRGNLIITSEKIRQLGAKTTKALNADLVADAEASAHAALPEAE